MYYDSDEAEIGRERERDEENINDASINDATKHRWHFNDGTRNKTNDTRGLLCCVNTRTKEGLIK